MRSVAVLLAVSFLAACSAPSVTPPVADDSVVQFLISSAATDFRTHPPNPARFRNVRLGRVTTAGGGAQYLMCGEFQPAQSGSNAEWLSFATIKTSGYEQYIGGQAISACKGPSITWDKQDFSSALQSRFEATAGR